MQTVGLRTHIWNNAIRSLLLLAGFPVLLLLIAFAFAVIAEALSGTGEDVGQGLANAVRALPSFLPFAVGGALLWFAIAFFINTRLIGAMTGARSVARKEEPRLYNLLENLCISRGLSMPKLRIIETPALNAFASGVTREQYTVTVTRGLMEKLDDAELEAVLAHELTHIRGGDVRLLMVATVFVGIFSLIAGVIGRGRFLRLGGLRGMRMAGGGRGRGGGGGAALILLLVAVACILLARLLSLVIRFALSRRREYMADAGAVELTKNPDAMISALRKIEGQSRIEAVPDEVRAMFLDDQGDNRAFSGLFATHPSIDSRVAALVAFAGGRDPGRRPPPPPPARPAPGPSVRPWG